MIRDRALRLALSVSLCATSVCLAATLPGCASRGGSRAATYETPRSEGVSLSRGDWRVGVASGVWKVFEQGRAPVPKPLGYVILRTSREVRGGPALTYYEVTTLDREEVVGLVDGLGNAKRFVPRRNAVDTVDVGNNSLALNVQAIFQTVYPVVLEKTSEQTLAFEMLDQNGDGYLDAKEYPGIDAKRGSPDLNRDGRIDPQEFANADLR